MNLHFPIFILFLLFLVFKSMNLLQNVTSTVNEVCKRLKREQDADSSVRPGRVRPSSVCAIKNGRRKMEDRHTVLHDLNVVFADQSPKVRRKFCFCIALNAHSLTDRVAKKHLFCLGVIL